MTRFALSVSVCSLITAVGVCRAQSEPARQKPPYPGHEISPISTPELDAIVMQRFQDELDERDARLEEALREGTRLTRFYNETARTEDSPRVMFQAGYRFLQAEEWEAADEAFRTVLEQYPDSIWAFEARLCLFDAAFEIDCDPNDVATLLDVVEVAAANAVDAEALPSVATVPPARPFSELPIQVPGPDYAFTAEFRIAQRSWALVYRDFLLRQALWAVLQGEIDAARDSYTEATKISHNFSGPVSTVGRHVYVSSPFWLKCEDAGESDSTAYLLLQYSDLLFHASMPYRSHRMLGRLLEHPDLVLTDLQRSYLHFQRASARSSMQGMLERLPEPIVDDLLKSQELASQAHWASHALLRAGHVEWTLDYCDPVALEHWQRVIDEYPDSPFAPQAAQLMGAFHEQQEQWIDAYRAYRLVRERYPESHAYESAGERLVEIRPHLPEAFFIESDEPVQ